MKHRRDLIAVLSCTAIIFLVLWTIPHFGYHCDEPIYELATQKIDHWLNLPFSQKLDYRNIEKFWVTYPQLNVHPSGLKWLNVIAHRVTSQMSSDVLYQDRVVIALYFSFSLIFFIYTTFPNKPYWMILVPLLILSQPRFFSQTHFAVTEMPMIGTMLLIWGFWTRWFRTQWVWILCPLFGFFWSIKLTCWILSAIMIVLLLLSGKLPLKKVIFRLCLVLVGGVIVYYVLNPDYWFHPWERLSEFLSQSLTRHHWTPIATMYWGKLYIQRGPLHYPFVMVGITTPLIHLGLLLAGLSLHRWWKKPSWRDELPIVVMGFFMIFFMLLPISPAHDNERYLLPGYPFLAVIMVWGIEELTSIGRRLWKHIGGRVVAAALGALVAWGSYLTVQAFHAYHPHELSYFNELIGGVKGAEKKGFEVTYLFDVLSPSVIDRLNNTCAGSRVYFIFPFQPMLMEMLTAQGRLRCSPTLSPTGIRFVAIYGRPSVGFWKKTLHSGMIPPYLELQLCWQETADGVPIFQLYRIQKRPS